MHEVFSPSQSVVTAKLHDGQYRDIYEKMHEALSKSRSVVPLKLHDGQYRDNKCEEIKERICLHEQSDNYYKLEEGINFQRL